MSTLAQVLAQMEAQDQAYNEEVSDPSWYGELPLEMHGTDFGYMYQELRDHLLRLCEVAHLMPTEVRRVFEEFPDNPFPDACPHCSLCAFVDDLSTTNEWRRHCTKCDIRFNDKGEIRPDDQRKVKR